MRTCQAFRIVVSLPLLTACSFAFVRGPASPPHTGSPETCTREPGFPIVDALAATGAAAIGADILRNPCQHANDSFDACSTEYALTAIGIGAVFAASGVYGLWMTNACGSARRISLTSSRRAFADQLNLDFAANDPPIAFSTEGEYAETLIVRSAACNRPGQHFLVVFMATPALKSAMTDQEFTRAVCAPPASAQEP